MVLQEPFILLLDPVQMKLVCLILSHLNLQILKICLNTSQTAALGPDPDTLKAFLWSLCVLTEWLVALHPSSTRHMAHHYFSLYHLALTWTLVNLISVYGTLLHGMWQAHFPVSPIRAQCTNPLPWDQLPPCSSSLWWKACWKCSLLHKTTESAKCGTATASHFLSPPNSITLHGCTS